MESNIEKNEELQWQLEQAIEEKEQVEKDNDAFEKRIVELERNQTKIIQLERSQMNIIHKFDDEISKINNRLLELEMKQNE